MAQVFVSIGSNIEKEKYIPKSLTCLEKAFGRLTLSSLFESEAIGFEGPIFYNMVVGFNTEKTVEQVASELRELEYANGRDPNAVKNSPRTLDLDLLLFDDLIISTPAQLPREEITKNAFVLWPLSEIAGEIAHPIAQKTYSQLWLEYDKSSQKLKAVPLYWTSSI